jgi:hypothetical protein
MLDSYKLILFDPIHGLVEIIKIIMSNQYGNVNLSSINNLIILISSFILVYIINIYQKNNFLLKISNFNKIIMIELLSLYVLFFGLLSGSSFIYIKF